MWPGRIKDAKPSACIVNAASSEPVIRRLPSTRYASRVRCLFFTDVGQWHVQDVKIQTGREDAVPFFILVFSDGAQKTRPTSMHVLHMGGGGGWLVLLP
jgi:hypothetical protein